MENHSFEEVLVMYSGYIENLEQVEFLKKKLSGHNILLGAAGTGKTNLAIAKMQEMVCQENVGNTLFVTYTNALTSTCADDIKELFESASLFDKPYVEIKTFHSLVSAINRQITGNNVRYLTKPKNIIYKALYNCIDKYPDGKEEFAKDVDIFLDEIDFLESFDVSSLEEYENIVRSNRRVKSIRKNVRKYYWYVYEEYLKILRRNSDCDFQGAGRYILELGRHYELPKYKNIFIDGTKIEANSNKYSFVWKKSVDKFERKLKKKMIEKVNEINEEFGKCYATDSDSLNVTLYSEIIDDLNKIINEAKILYKTSIL